MFNKKVGDPEGRGLPDGLRFAEEALAVLLPALIVMTVALEVLAWPVTLLLGRVQRGFARTVCLCGHAFALTIPYLMLISLVSLFGGILNSLHKFWVNAAAPILLNLTLIVALLAFTARSAGYRAQPGDRGIGFGRAATGVAGLGLPPERVRLAAAPRLNPDVKKLMALIWPAAAGAGRCRSTWSSRPRWPPRCWPWQRHLYLHGRPAEPVAARADRHWPGHGAAAHDLAPVGRGRG
jgi:putative peptidoglycan lipid II flippase